MTATGAIRSYPSLKTPHSQETVTVTCLLTRNYHASIRKSHCWNLLGEDKVRKCTSSSIWAKIRLMKVSVLIVAAVVRFATLLSRCRKHNAWCILTASAICFNLWSFAGLEERWTHLHLGAWLINTWLLFDTGGMKKMAQIACSYESIWVSYPKFLVILSDLAYIEFAELKYP